MFRICPDPTIPEREPLLGWRLTLNKWFGIKFKRPIVVRVYPQQRLLTHPNNVQQVAAFLTRRGNKYIVTPMLVAAPLEDKH